MTHTRVNPGRQYVSWGPVAWARYYVQIAICGQFATGDYCTELPHKKCDKGVRSVDIDYIVLTLTNSSAANDASEVD
jgi:hypothetical protein